MQKKLIALAVAGLASTAAFAQSNVTIYGVADASFDNVRATGATAAADFKARNRVTSNSSYIGFKGVEDLGNGVKAVFQLENGVNFDNGAAGAWNNRDSYVGLAGGFGTVVSGNVTGPTRALGAKLDINNGATGIGANTALLGKLGGGSGAGAFDQRITNAVAYISPEFSGVTAVVGYSTGLTNTFNGTALSGKENAAAADSAKGNTAWTGGLNYSNGPVYVGYAYTGVSTTNSGVAAADGLAAGWKKLSDNRLAAIYNFGAGQVGVLWDQAKLNTTAGTSTKQDVFYVNGKYNIGSGAVIAQYGMAKDLKASSKLNDTGAKNYAVGYEYSLSKRTVLKAVYAKIDNDKNANYDFLYGVSAANSTATAAGVNAGANVSGFSVGVRHAF